MIRHCILCGRDLPVMPWWRRVMFVPLDECRDYGLNLDDCWRGLNNRLGNEYPGPRPS